MPDKHEQHSIIVTVRMQQTMVDKLIQLAGPHGTLSKVIRALLIKALGKI